MGEREVGLYLREMCYIKNRMNAIRSIAMHEYTTPYPFTNIEFMTLQIRKVIEHIAMGNLIANKELYKEYSDKFSSNWNAKYIFRDLERLNPNFYPEPVKTDESKGEKEWITLTEDYLSKEEAIHIYNKCGALMHVSNPYGSQTDITYYDKMILVWYEKIIHLLSQHLIRLVDTKTIYCIVMREQGEQPQGYIFERID